MRNTVMPEPKYQSSTNVRSFNLEQTANKPEIDLGAIPKKTEETEKESKGVFCKFTTNLKEALVVVTSAVIIAFSIPTAQAAELPKTNYNAPELSAVESLEEKQGAEERERPQQTKGAMDFAMENVDEILGQKTYMYTYVEGELDWDSIDSLNLGLFYTDVDSGDTLSFPSDSSMTLYSTSGDTIIVGYSEFIEADTSILPGTRGWRVEISGKKWDELEPPRGTGSYWIKVKEIEVHFDTTFNEETIDYYPLGEDVMTRIWYRGRAPPNDEYYREIDVYGPVITWDIDTTSLDISETRVPEQKDMRLYPNPTNNAQFNLIIKNRDINTPIRVFDMLGREVPNTQYDKKEHTGTLRMNIDNLPSGAYSIVWVEEENGLSKQRTETLIITK